MDNLVPLTTDPDQSFTITLPIDGKNLTFDLRIRYNTEDKFWWLSITDHETEVMLLDSIPLLTADYPAANILEQYKYLNIGSIVIVPNGNSVSGDPDDTNLGIDYYMLWGDTNG